MPKFSCMPIARAQYLVTATLLCYAASAQPPSPTTLVIDSDNQVEYLGETTDVLKLGTDPNITTPLLPNTFFNGQRIADIVSVNGQPAKGVALHIQRIYGLTTTITPNRPIADVNRASFSTVYYEIVAADGTPIGTILTSGMSGGSLVVIGGTGAVLGARGQSVPGPARADFAPVRLASTSEDPSRRRIHGGGRNRVYLQFYPTVYPQVILQNGAPAIVHSNDLSPVSREKPAAAGEVLALFATGLGVTSPSLNPGATFPSSPTASVISPVEVTIGDKRAKVLTAAGHSGSSDRYQINFRMPEGVPSGDAQVRISSAWVNSAAVTIRIK